MFYAKFKRDWEHEPTLVVFEHRARRDMFVETWRYVYDAEPVESQDAKRTAMLCWRVVTDGIIKTMRLPAFLFDIRKKPTAYIKHMSDLRSIRPIEP